MESIRITSVRAHDDGLDRWEVIEATPARVLRSHVVRYSSYWEQTRSFTTRRELAGTSGVLIYALGAPLELVGADGCSLTVKAGEAFVGGIANATSLSRALGSQAGIQIFLPPATLSSVIGAPIAEVANRVVPLSDFLGRVATDLGSALCDAVTAEARFEHLDSFLVDRCAREHRGFEPVTWAMKRLKQSAGPATAMLAREIGWSRQHFIRRFRAATGFSPDQFRRLTRFERFVATLSAVPNRTLATLAADAGYSDQAHLTREVRNFSNMTPGELRARLLPASGGIRD
jgi:AraC-like DNA-binding protein